MVIYNATAQSGVLITGVTGHAIEDVSLSNIQMWFKGGGTKEQAARVPPELETGYSEPDNMGTMPSMASICATSYVQMFGFGF